MQSRRSSLGIKVITVGRNKKNSLVLENTTISEWHAEIIVRGNSYSVRDLGSKFGTSVNGKRVTTAHLKEGDLVSFGFNAYSFVCAAKGAESMQGGVGMAELDQVGKEIDLSQLAQPRANASGESSVSSGLKSDKPVSKPAEVTPASEPAIVPRADVSPRAANATAWRAAWKPIAILVSGALFLALLLSQHSRARHRRAYNLGYETGLVEFAQPPRNLQLSMVLDLSRPAAFRQKIGKSDFDDFVKGAKDASRQTYYHRFHAFPQLD